MAWRIHKNVERGEIDNREKGKVKGKIWLAGRQEPLILKLKGNCHRDLAGTLLTFSNPKAVDDEESNKGLFSQQEGNVGDMTASRKIKVPTVSEEELNQLIKMKKPIPFELGNCIYLEWFSERNGRVVIEAANYEWKVSLPKWQMTEKEESEQLEKNAEGLIHVFDLEEEGEALEEGDGEHNHLNEFEWEKLLKEADEKTDRLMKLIEEHQGDPNFDEIIAKALEEEGDMEYVEFSIEEREEGDEGENEGEEESKPKRLELPPLARKLIDLSVNMESEAEKREIPKEKSSDICRKMINECYQAGGKLAAGLGMAGDESDYEPDPGFVVANLKRAVNHVHQALGALERMEWRYRKQKKWIQQLKKELFNIREEIITLMIEYRKRV